MTAESECSADDVRALADSLKHQRTAYRSLLDFYGEVFSAQSILSEPPTPLASSEYS